MNKGCLKNAGHRPCRSPPPFKIWHNLTRSYTRVFLNDVTTGIPINNSWICRVKWRWKHLLRKVRMLCVGHKRNVNTVYASPVLTPAPTHHIWLQRNSHSTDGWLCFVGFSPNRKAVNFNPVLTWMWRRKTERKHRTRIFQDFCHHLNYKPRHKRGIGKISLIILWSKTWIRCIFLQPMLKTI